MPRDAAGHLTPGGGPPDPVTPNGPLGDGHRPGERVSARAPPPAPAGRCRGPVSRAARPRAAGEPSAAAGTSWRAWGWFSPSRWPPRMIPPRGHAARPGKMSPSTGPGPGSPSGPGSPNCGTPLGLDLLQPAGPNTDRSTTGGGSPCCSMPCRPHRRRSDPGQNDLGIGKNHVITPC